jgi:hypothetical protein
MTASDGWAWLMTVRWSRRASSTTALISSSVISTAPATALVICAASLDTILKWSAPSRARERASFTISAGPSAS